MTQEQAHQILYSLYLQMKLTMDEHKTVQEAFMVLRPNEKPQDKPKVG